MSNAIDLRASRSLELLRKLRETVSRYADLEEELFETVRSGTFAEKRSYRDAVARADARLDAELGAVAARARSEEERVRELHAGRHAYVERVRSDRVVTLPRRAREAKERWMGDLQMRQFNADRRKSAELKVASGAFEAASKDLESRKAAYRELLHRARVGLRGYPALSTRLKSATKGSESAGKVSDLDGAIETATERMDEFDRHWMPRFFSVVPLPVQILIAAILGVLAALAAGAHADRLMVGGGTFILLSAMISLLYGISRQVAKRESEQLIPAMGEVQGCLEAAIGEARRRRDAQQGEIEAEHARISGEIVEQWNRAGTVEEEFARVDREKTETSIPHLLRKNSRILERRLAQIAERREEESERLRREAEATRSDLDRSNDSRISVLNTKEEARWRELTDGWRSEIAPLRETVDSMNEKSGRLFPDWSESFVQSWVPPETPVSEVRFGAFQVDFSEGNLRAPRDPRLAIPRSLAFEIPAALAFPEEGSILLETSCTADRPVAGVLNNLALRLFAITPPGRLALTILDPVGLGQNFAGLMHLADHEESLINRRIWTQRDQIEERLAELNAHIEKIIQMYLRNEYATISEYNAQAGSTAEKYHFLVISDFPSGFGEVAAKRLQSIVTSGPHCGVFTLIHWNTRQPLPDGIDPDDLRKSSVRLMREGDRFFFSSPAVDAISLDEPPAPELAIRLVHRIGESSIDANRVEVPFEQIVPAEFWKNDTTDELRIAIGRTGATKYQYLAIGKGTRQHALFAGKTGSGKSTLFHVIITNLALACSPDQVEFYLIDFKKGVEFKCYAEKRLPHARVVAIESDREFGLSVLQRVDEELKRRGDMFRKLGVQDIAGYKRAGGVEPVPRTLLIIDEFQEFFVEDDTIAQSASVLFDRIVRQGRAFGIHVLLGSQTLGGAYSLARATLGQMVVRVALQCNEADAYLIMDDNNPAPRMLSRPGEGIYNDSAGALEGNSPFQVVWLPDEERDAWLDKVSALAREHGDRHPGPVVFEGNAPARIRENRLLAESVPADTRPPIGRVWLGAPNSIKGPTEAVFSRQSGSNLLFVGQREDAVLSFIGVSLLALAAQYRPEDARFVVVDASPPGSSDSDFLGTIAAVVPNKVEILHGADLPQAMNELANEMKVRGETAEDSPEIYLLIRGLQKFKKLKSKDEFAFSLDTSDAADSAAQFTDLISEGAPLGIHVVASVDTCNNVNRFLSRKTLGEFEMRVLFQMSANDSAALIDSPRASALGLHRALFYNEQEGYLETFRPYAQPDAEWIREFGDKLKSAGIGSRERIDLPSGS